MAKTRLIWESEERIIIKFPQSKEILHYKGILRVSEKKIKAVTLNITCIIGSYGMENFMEREKSFTGDSISEVYGKMSKYFHKWGMVFIG
jgi:hypothetical protein